MTLKALILTCCLLALVSCEKKNPKPTRVVNKLCSGEVTEKCELPTQYIIESSKPFPQNIKIYFKNSIQRVEAFDQCDPKADVQHFPIEGVSMIGFRASSHLFKNGMRIEILDRGENCDSTSPFFDEAIVPRVTDSWENTRDTKTFVLYPSSKVIEEKFIEKFDVDSNGVFERSELDRILFSFEDRVMTAHAKYNNNQKLQNSAYFLMWFFLTEKISNPGQSVQENYTFLHSYLTGRTDCLTSEDLVSRCYEGYYAKSGVQSLISVLNLKSTDF